MESVTIKASCLCGFANHELELHSSDLPLNFGLCHCTSCRRMTGTLHLTYVNLPKSYSPSKDLLSRLTTFQFSERLTEYFCSRCGTHMLSYVPHSAHNEHSGAQWDVMSGTLERVNDILEIEAHDFIVDTLDGGFADFMLDFKGKAVPRFATFTNKSKELPLRWFSPDRVQRNPSPSDRLHGHCKCGGVDFWISRPSEQSKNAQSAWPDLLVPHYTNEKVSDSTAWWLRDGGTKFLAGVCGCDSCRLDTGMEWMEWAFIPTVDISLDAEGKMPFKLPFGTLKAYSSSEGITRYHCGICGASTFFTASDRTDLVDVSVGLLDAPEGARAESWLDFHTDRLSFREDAVIRAKDLTLAVENGLARFQKQPKIGFDAA